MMMMAHDSSSGHTALTEETIRGVRTALVHYVSAPAGTHSLRTALHDMAAEAREKAIPPEHLLILLKEIWYSLPAVNAIGEASEQVALLQRAVTMCIKEYYTP